LEELLTYCVAQVAGAIAAALVLYMILSSKASGWNGALGQTTWSEYNTLSAFIFETVGTFLFLVCHRTDTCCHTPRWDQYLWIIGESGAIARPAMVGYAHNPEALKQIWLYIR
jgi:aquaporin Z